MNLNKIIDAYTDWKSVNSCVEELSALDDHQLNDIGIRRANIREAARETVRRHRAQHKV